MTDISDGGITTALGEHAIASGIGCETDLEPVIVRHECSAEHALFGEAPGGFIVAGYEKSQIELLAGQGVEVDLLGEVGGEDAERHCRRDAGRGGVGRRGLGGSSRSPTRSRP